MCDCNWRKGMANHHFLLRNHYHSPSHSWTGKLGKGKQFQAPKAEWSLERGWFQNLSWLKGNFSSMSPTLTTLIQRLCVQVDPLIRLWILDGSSESNGYPSVLLDKTAENMTSHIAKPAKIWLKWKHWPYIGICYRRRLSSLSWLQPRQNDCHRGYSDYQWIKGDNQCWLGSIYRPRTQPLWMWWWIWW